MLTRTSCLLALVLSTTIGCVVTHTETPDEREARQHQLWLDGQATAHERTQQDRAAAQAKQAAYLVQQRAAGDAIKQEKDDAFAADCRSDLSDREVEMQKRLASRAHTNELVQWEIDHCKFVDNSKAVVRTAQDSRGEFHTFEGRDRRVDRVCDSTPPKEIEHTYSAALGVYRMPPQSEGRTMKCEHVDMQTSEIAKDYWSHGSRER